MENIIEFFDKNDSKDIVKNILWFNRTQLYDPLLSNINENIYKDWIDTIIFLTEDIIIEELDILNDDLKSCITKKIDDLQFRYQKYKQEEYQRIKKEYLEQVKKYFNKYYVICIFTNNYIPTNISMSKDNIKKTILTAIVDKLDNNNYKIIDIIFQNIKISEKISFKTFSDGQCKYILPSNKYNLSIYKLTDWGFYESYQNDNGSFMFYDLLIFES